MIDNLAHDARHLIYIRSPRYDMQLLDEVRKVLENSDSQKILIVLHCYGSHFSYHQRYPREFADFRPEGDVAIAKQHRQTLVNAYDNSIRYTDHFLAETIAYLRTLEDTSTALLYCADHGEDLIDDDRERFPHASPTTDRPIKLQRKLRGRGSPTPTAATSPRRSRPPRRTKRPRPRRMRCFIRWPIWPRSKDRFISKETSLVNSGYDPHGAAPLPERPQRSRPLPQNGTRPRGHGSIPPLRHRTLTVRRPENRNRKRQSRGIYLIITKPIIRRTWLSPSVPGFCRRHLGRIAEGDGVQQPVRIGQLQAAQQLRSFRSVQEAAQPAETARPHSHGLSRENHVAAQQAAIHLREVVSRVAGDEDQGRSAVSGPDAALSDSGRPAARNIRTVGPARPATRCRSPHAPPTTRVPARWELAGRSRESAAAYPGRRVAVRNDGCCGGRGSSLRPDCPRQESRHPPHDLRKRSANDSRRERDRRGSRTKGVSSS